MLDYLRLCLITDHRKIHLVEYKNFLARAIAGGVTSVQLRLKTANSGLIHDTAQELKSLLDSLHIPLIINDHVEIAKAVDAAGVHLGQTDLSVQEARKILGPNKIIGLSVESIEDLEVANTLSCINYIAGSAVFHSTNKLDCKTYWGLEGLKTLVENSTHPVIGIGGININNIACVMAQGVAGVAVIAALHNAADPQITASRLKRIIDHTTGETVCSPQ